MTLFITKNDFLDVDLRVSLMSHFSDCKKYFHHSDLCMSSQTDPRTYRWQNVGTFQR